MAGVTAWKSMYWMPITCWKYCGIRGLICNYWIVFSSGLVTRHSPSRSEHTWIQIAAVLILSLVHISLQDWKQAVALPEHSYRCAFLAHPAHSPPMWFPCCSFLFAVCQASVFIVCSVPCLLSTPPGLCTAGRWHWCGSCQSPSCLHITAGVHWFTPVTGSCLCKNVLKAFWIDQFIIYCCLEELTICKWSYEALGLQYSLPYDGILCKGNDFLVMGNLSAITAERGHEEENLIYLLERYNLMWICQHFYLWFLTNFEFLVLAFLFRDQMEV